MTASMNRIDIFSNDLYCSFYRFMTWCGDGEMVLNKNFSFCLASDSFEYGGMPTTLSFHYVEVALPISC